MAAGKYRDLVRFERRQLDPDGHGGSAKHWILEFKRMGRLQIESGTERLKAGRNEATERGTVQVRYDSQTNSVTNDWRLVIDGVPYVIENAVNVGRRNKEMEFTVERGRPT